MELPLKKWLPVFCIIKQKKQLHAWLIVIKQDHVKLLIQISQIIF